MFQLFDNLVNFLSGLGVQGRDKATGSTYFFTPLPKEQLDAAYRTDWMARKLIDIPAKDATREWRSWQTSTNAVEKLEAEEKRLNIACKLRDGLILARLYGGAALILGVDQGRSGDELQIDRVRKGDLKFIQVCSRYALGTGTINNDVMSPYFGQPMYFTRTSASPVAEVKNNSGNMTVNGSEFQIHPSRVIMLRGPMLPDQITTGEIWGDSVLQSVLDAVQAAGMVSAAGATMVNETKIDVIKIPQLSMHMQNDEYQKRLTERFSYANTAKSIVNTIVMDKEEDWQRINANFGGLPELLKLYLLIASGAADIPATRFLGQSPVGMNATGDADVRNYYDRIASEQKTDIAYAISQLDEVLIRSALGTREESIYYEWNPLWQMDEVQKSEVCLRKAQIFSADVGAGVIDSEVLRIGRQNQLIEDGLYPGLEEALEQQEELDLDSMGPSKQDALQSAQELIGQAQQSLGNDGPGGPDTGGGYDVPAAA
jgi:uncharacterized protein